MSHFSGPIFLFLTCPVSKDSVPMKKVFLSYPTMEDKGTCSLHKSCKDFIKLQDHSQKPLSLPLAS